MIFWTKFAKKSVLPKTEKENSTIESCVLEIVQVRNFSLNWQFIFFYQICRKRVFLLSNRKANTTIDLCILEIVLVPNFRLNWQLRFFNPISSKKGVTCLKHHHWYLLIQIILGIQFQLKLTILIFWTKLSQKGCFLCKTKKVNTTKGLGIFKLVSVPNFSLNWRLWLFGSSFPNDDVSCLRQKM